ncbi:hypothetical protein [Streptacidiphilus sp. EB129]|jgi:hypothetical protein|uniref:hypothetical protein n=1 Tax=Streptacidiphilus sp. EB129 TaxID=3156262 RepID=UPI0035171609
MADSVSPSTLALPVDDALLARLHGEACITCGTIEAPLTAAGHIYTGDQNGGRYGWPVVACPVHLGVPVPLTHPDSVRPPLTPSQDFRVGVARHDLERARQVDLSGVAPAELLLLVSALTGTVEDLLRLVGDLAEVTE